MKNKKLKIQIRTEISERKVKKYNTKKSFWASYCALEFKDKRLEKLHKDLLEIEDKLGNVRSKFLEEFTNYKNE